MHLKVLSYPLLCHSVYHDCQGTIKTPIVKYSDDTAIEDLSNSDSVYFFKVHKFSAWSKENYLDLNVAKTEEMVVDFRKNLPPVPDLIIDDVVVERVDEYRYLGTVLDNNLTFDSNVDSIHKKCQSCIYCLQKLRNTGVASDILEMDYRASIVSTHSIFYVLVWKSWCAWEESVEWCCECVQQCCRKETGLYAESVRETTEAKG